MEASRKARQRPASDRAGRFLAVILFLDLLTPSVPSVSSAQDEPTIDEPRLVSVFPWGGQRGTTVKAEVRGYFLEGATAVWFDSGNFKTRLLRVEEAEADNQRLPIGTEKPKKPLRAYRAWVEVQIDANTPPAIYPVRVVTPRGLTNSIQFPVLDESVVLEMPSPHQTVDQAQAVDIPAIINGRLSRPGELDYYSFRAQRGQELQFEAIPGENLGRVVVSDKFDPQLALYRRGGSWFDSRRPTELVFQEERSSDLIPVEAKGTYRFDADGPYYVEVSGMYGAGCLDCTYQLRIVSRQKASELRAETKPIEPSWTERSFNRHLGHSWITSLGARLVPPRDEPAAPQKSVIPPGAGGAISPARLSQGPTSGFPPLRPLVVEEREPNDPSAQAQPISIPGFAEGVISRPGDVDSFRFHVKPGEKLAFEIETPEAQPPQFNPRFAVIDSQDHELFSSVHRSVSLFNANADRHPYLKAVDPKVIYTFENGGDYVLQVRDITSRYSGPNFRYRILIRPQVPHVGEVAVLDGNHINLKRGDAKKLTIVTSYEEGFAGQVSFRFVGLPAGVEVSPGAELTDDKAPSDVDEEPGRVAPKRQKTTVVLFAQPNAPLSSSPQVVHLYCQPIVDGKLGPSFVARDIPMMVIESTQGKQEGQ